MDVNSSKNEKYGETKQCDSGFTFVDFFPKKLPPTGFFRTTTYENLRVVVDRANEFLKSNSKWKVFTCETVRFKLKMDPFKVTYKRDREFATQYIRGLRLWLTEKDNEKERIQQIGFMSLIPEKVTQGGVFSSSEYETLNSVIQRFNSMLKHNLPGRIISIESKEMPYSNFEKFDPDLSNWIENGRRNNNFIFVIRIFYEAMDGKAEEIGVRDFIPAQIPKEGFFSDPEYEPFSTVMQQASAWLSQQGHLRFCNAQTLEIKLGGRGVESNRMVYDSLYSSSSDYVRILRVAYTIPYTKPSPITKLICRDFVPMQLKAGLYAFKYENLEATKERISRWVKESGARILSAETTIYRVKSGGDKKQGTEATYSDISEFMITDEYLIFIIRFYLDG